MRVSDDVPLVDSQQDPESWGLARVSQRELPLSNAYKYAHAAGTGVDVYVIDNGVLIEHEDFGGRAVDGIIVPRGEKSNDGNHGSHVSSTIAGTRFGIAKNATIINVKVLSSSGYGSTADVLKGIEWTAEEHLRKLSKNNRTKSCANMSLGGGRSTALDIAVTRAIASGV